MSEHVDRGRSDLTFTSVPANERLLKRKGKNKLKISKMSRMTDFMTSTNGPPKSFLRKDTEPEIDIENPIGVFEQNEEIKQLGTSTVTTDEQHESQYP